MARRLGIPLRDLVQAPPAPAPDLTTIAGEIDLALTEIAVLLHQQQAAAALQQLTDLAATHQGQLPRLPWSARYRLHLLRAEAHLRMGHRQDARGAAEAALALTEDQADPDASLAARTVLGTILLQAGAVQAAQELLEQCRQTLDRAQVPDPHLALRIYERLLTTYQTLDKPERAAAVAQEAADRLPTTAPLPQWARCYLADAEATRERDPQRAPHYIAHALATFMLVETLQTAARMQIAQAARLIDWQQFSEADTLLTQVAPHIAVAGDPVLSLHLTLRHARLAHAQQDLEQAQARVGAEIALGEQTLVEHATIDPATQAELHAALARLLQIAGLIAEEQGDLQTADAAFTRAISVQERDRSCLAADIAAAYADLLTARGDHVAAVRHYQVALRYQRWSAAQPV